MYVYNVHCTRNLILFIDNPFFGRLRLLRKTLRSIINRLKLATPGYNITHDVSRVYYDEEYNN